MAKFIILFPSLLWTLYCTSQKCVIDCPLITEKYQYINGAGIIDRPDNKIKKAVTQGSNIVFRLYRDYYCETNPEQEYQPSLVWSVVNNLTTFTLDVSESDSLTMPLYFSDGARGPGAQIPHRFKTASGTIKGNKVGNIWKVELDITVYYYDIYNEQLEKMSFKESRDFILWTKKDKRSYLTW